MAEITKHDVETHAPSLSLIRHTGMLIAWQQVEHSYRGSPEQLLPALKAVTLKNMIFGWWSPMSLIINPIINIVNVVHYFQYKKQFAMFMDSPKTFIEDQIDIQQKNTVKAAKKQKRGLIILGILGSVLAVLIISAMLTSK